MNAKRAVIAAIYTQVDAPDWAATNLDALADVLRDLSWLPIGPVTINLPDLAELTDDQREAVRSVLAQAVRETAATGRPVKWRATR
ncbi:MAG: barstar family protein [Jatrophihabitantaceae bacterium]